MKDFMTKDEMEDYFKISSTTLRRWEKWGLKYSQIGGTKFYPAEWVKEFIENNWVMDYER